jgi:hypothetical protein
MVIFMYVVLDSVIISHWFIVHKKNSPSHMSFPS